MRLSHKWTVNLRVATMFQGCFAILPFSILHFSALGQNVQFFKYTPNDYVSTIINDSATNTIYLSGGFDRIGIPRHNGVLFDTTTGLADLRVPDINGVIHTTISDNHGGWFVGGDFTRIGDSIRNGLGHLDSNGQVTSLARYGFNNSVMALHLVGDTLLVGGGFSGYKPYQTSKSYYSVFDTSTGLTARDLPPSNYIIKKAVKDARGGWYVYGEFTKMGDSLRNGIAYITPEGYIGDFDCPVDGPIYSMALKDSLLYVGGQFNLIGDEQRYNIGCINILTSQPTTWKPDADKSVNYLVVTDSVVYAGGSFHAIGSALRNSLAAISVTTGKSTSWNPNHYGNVNFMAVYNNLLFAAGLDYTNPIAVFNLITGEPLNWLLNPDNALTAMLISGDTLYMAGKFTNIGTTPRKYLAAIDLLEQQLTSWNPNPNREVRYMSYSDQKLYVTGDFDSINNQKREHAACITTSGLINQWEPTISDPFSITCLSADPAGILISSYEQSYYEQPCSGLAAINIHSGELIPNIPSVDGLIAAFEQKGNTLFVGGYFNQIGDSTRKCLAAIDLPSGTILPLHQWFDGGIKTMKYHNNQLFVGGYFIRVGDAERLTVAALNPVSGDLLAWNPTFDSTISMVINSIDCDHNFLYAVGQFQYYGNGQFASILRFNLDNGIIDNWYPEALGRYNTIKVAGNKVFVGGNTLFDPHHPNTGIGCFDIATSQWINTGMTVDGEVESIVLQGNKLFAGGRFSVINGDVRMGFAAIDANTQELLSFNPHFNDHVHKMIKHHDCLYFLGSFDAVNNIPRKGMAKINLKSGELEPWAPYTNSIYNQVYDITIWNDRVLLGGYFDSINGTSRKFLAAVDTITGAILPWNPITETDGTQIGGLVVKDSTLYVSGNFNNINGVYRRNAASFGLTDATLKEWGPYLSQFSHVLFPYESSIIISRKETINNKYRSKLIAVDDSTGNTINWVSTLNIETFHSSLVNNDTIYVAGRLLSSNQNLDNSIVTYQGLSEQTSEWIPLNYETPTSRYLDSYCMIPYKNGILCGGSFSWDSVTSTAHLIYIPVPPARPGAILGVANPCPAMNGNTYSVDPAPNTQYTWSYTGQGANIVSGQGTHAIVVDFDSAATPGYIVVKPRRDGATGIGRSFRVDFSPIIPSKPVGNNLVDLLLTPTSDYFCNNLGADASIIWTLQPDSLGTITNLADTAVITWLKTGTAQLFARVDYTCGNEYSDTLTIVVKNASATPETANNSPRVTPNPFNRLLTLEIPSGQTATKMELFDITGSLIFSTSGDFTGKKVLDPGPLPKGIYLFRVVGGNVWTTKLVCY
ncbi:MAG: T9SS type A sorting domain-containing protein [Bacteroidales bacterium]|nr:T9SS type A sorting domain-containing protein [Bacteroidales bacterium]MDD3665405.1 T9SS type A sorting domain-containing protein [Bacteroidales bacterium]